jgi:phage-related protein
MKRLEFLGDSLAQLRAFTLNEREELGVELHKVQLGLPPSDWKPMTTVGAGVRETGVRETGAYRALYLVNVGEAVYVLHAFQKKTQQTSKRDLELAAARLGQL